MAKPSLSMETVNPHVRDMEYAVRGPIVTRAGEIEKELASGQKKDFTRVIRANIGDCHATGQEPVTFIRQVLAICSYPKLLKNDSFPADVKKKAQRILSGCRGSSVGSYTDSPGIMVIREDVASYISKRDGIPSRPEDIIMCTGASDGIKTILSLLMTGGTGDDRAGVMIPVPQYPLYSATLTEYNACPVPYYLDEDTNWGMSVEELNRSISAVKSHCKPRAICVINPGNPTGQVLTHDNIKLIIKFAKEHNLMILADEVYQHNIWAEGSKFHSFKKVLKELGPDYDSVALASFMSASKGFMGECGSRGGYYEVINLDPEVKACLLKFISAKLCPPVLGQATMDTIVNPPQQGELSYDTFKKETDFVLSQLHKKAKLVTELFNSMEGIQCNEVQGAMYAFPRILLPQKAIDAAKAKGMTPDSFYCFAMLEEIGLCTVPGSGFGEKEGTYHFRITILPPLEDIRKTLEAFKEFHLRFLQKYK